MPPFVVYLLGSPGVGKLTVARGIARQSGAVVVDNQLINIPIMSLFAWDGQAPLPPEIWDYIRPIRDTVFEAMEDSPPDRGPALRVPRAPIRWMAAQARPALTRAPHAFHTALPRGHLGDPVCGLPGS